MTPALAGVFGVVAQVEQGIVVLAADQDHIATASAVAAAGAALGNKLLPTKGQAAIAAVSGFYFDDDLVNEHR